MKQDKVSASEKKIARLLIRGVLNNDWYIINPGRNDKSMKSAAKPIIEYLKRKGVVITP